LQHKHSTVVTSRAAGTATRDGRSKMFSPHPSAYRSAEEPTQPPGELVHTGVAFTSHPI